MNPQRKFIAIAVVAMLLMTGAFLMLRKGSPTSTIVPETELPADYVIFVDEPETEHEMLLASSLSSLAVRDTYHPLFVIGSEGPTAHQLNTLSMMGMTGLTALYFSLHGDEPTFTWTGAIETYELDDDTLKHFLGFGGTITVASYEEALWASTLAAIKGRLIVPGPATYGSQEEAWDELNSLGVRADYVVVANPEDYRTDVFSSSGVRTKEDGEPLASPEPYNATFHIPSLSIVTSQLAQYHNAYVLTGAEPSTEALVDIDPEINGQQLGTLLKLRDMNVEYGPIEYICIVGSAEAVGQFQLYDMTDSDPANTEGDGRISCDSIYGFLDEDEYTMDAAVGRIVNTNVQGVTDQIARTFGFDYYQNTVVAHYETMGEQTVEWRKRASVWNGYEVADERRQMNPGKYAVQDFQDEGWTADYFRPSGKSGLISETNGETSFRGAMESSHLAVYRGHGSWHATYYVYKPEESTDPQSKSRLEGNDTARAEEFESSPSVVQFYLPPQVGIFVACENAKIEGCTWWGDVANMDMLWATNYFYAGGVGMIAATEVSFSNMGQDIYNKLGWFTGNYQWDLNNCWFAFPLDGLINHEDEYGTIGKAFQWAENRYINNPNRDNPISPFETLNTAHHKEITMFACYGDPAFRPATTGPGAGGFDPWHNGDGDV